MLSTGNVYSSLCAIPTDPALLGCLTLAPCFTLVLPLTLASRNIVPSSYFDWGCSQQLEELRLCTIQQIPRV
jgi:hypothetical protein